MNHYTKTIPFEKPAQQVFEALTNSIPKWWTELFEGASNKQGQTFTIRFGANIFKTMSVEELSTNKKVVWKVSDSLIDLPDLKNKTEWIGTKIVWEITQNGEKTELKLTHFGLTPQVECYDICQGGWEQFIYSLTEYINTGIGKPYKA